MAAVARILWVTTFTMHGKKKMTVRIGGKCSNCGGRMGTRRYHFCPWCGLPFDGVEEVEEQI